MNIRFGSLIAGLSLLSLLGASGLTHLCKDNIDYCKPMVTPGGVLQFGPECSQGLSTWSDGSCNWESVSDMSSENECVTKPAEKKDKTVTPYYATRNSAGTWECQAGEGSTTQIDVLCPALQDCPQTPAE